MMATARCQNQMVKKIKNNVQVYYFDFETKFVTNIQKDRVELVPNLCCVEKESGEAAKFYGDDATQQFMEWLLGKKVDGWRVGV